MRTMIAAAALLAGACATQAGGGRMAGDWRAVDLNGFPVTDPAPTLSLGPGGRAGGSGGCNQWSADYDFDARERLRFGPIASTKKACAPVPMEQEARYFDLLSRVRGYSLYGDGSLSLIGADGSAIRFRRP